MKSFINFHHANLILKLAETREEIEKARRLRYLPIIHIMTLKQIVVNHTQKF